MSTSPSSVWRERLSSPLTWHYVVFAVLLVLVIGLGVRVGLDWAATNGRSTDELAGKQIELKAMDLQTAPLRGLDKRVEESRKQIAAFYAKRIPAHYSSILTRIGELAVKSGVRLSRVSYTQGQSGQGPASQSEPVGDLKEISMDAGVSGSYPQIMHFVNSLERDQTFFVIRNMALTGQQGGMVNLRLRVSTWLRSADAADAADAAASGMTPTPEDNGTRSSPSAKEVD
jgi:Tfp pilus assembly protein PilO